MLSRLPATVSATHSPVPAWRPLPHDPEAAFLNLAGQVEALHILVVGRDTLETLCHLNEQGALSVTTARCGHCLPCEPVELVIVPHLDRLDVAELAIAHASGHGASLLLRLGAKASTALLEAVSRSLRQHGFSLAQIELPHHTVVRAERHHS